MADDKQISDEPAAVSLLTGAQLEIQDVTAGSLNVTIDTLLQGIVPDSPSQVAGFTAANIMEVEATLAARMTLRPDENHDLDGGWNVGRHCYVSSNFGYGSIGSAQSVAAGIGLEFGWVNVAGICVIKKVFVDYATGASTNTAAGSAIINMFRTFGLGPVLDTTNVQTPGSQGGGAGVTGRSPITGCSGLKANQPPPMARINGGINRTTRGAGVGENAWTDANPFGSAEAGYKAGAGQTYFRQAMLHDWLAHGARPLILVPGTGFEIQLTTPTTSSGSSTTFQGFTTILWDEWTLSMPS